MTQDLINIGRRLKAIRAQLGLSRREVYQKYKLPEITLASWETGTKEIGVLNLINYLNFFKEQGIEVDIGTILGSGKEGYLLSSLNNPLSEINLNLKTLENSNIFFYAHPEGIILYLNPKYKDLIKSSQENNALLSLANLFEPQVISSIIQDCKEAEYSIKPLSRISLGNNLSLEIYPHYNIYYNLEGIIGMLAKSAIKEIGNK